MPIKSKDIHANLSLKLDFHKYEVNWIVNSFVFADCDIKFVNYTQFDIIIL